MQNITPPWEAKQCTSYNTLYTFNEEIEYLSDILAPTELIDARSTGEPQGVSTMFYPMIQNILGNVNGRVRLPVEYPARPDQNTTSGEKFVVDTIVQGLHDCPKQK